EGLIEGRQNGFVVLAGNEIENRGTIRVPLGKVALASGEIITLDVSGNGMIAIGVEGNNLAAGPIQSLAQITNSGTLEAGHVEIMAKDANKLFDYAINQSGIIRAVGSDQI